MISAKSAIVENSARRSCRSVRRLIRIFRLFRVHQDFVEKRIDIGPERGDLFERHSIARALDLRLHDFVLVVQIALSPGFKQMLLKRSVRLEIRLLQDIADAFEAGRERLEIFRRPDFGERGEPRLDVGQSPAAGCQNGVDLVVFEAADFAEIVLNPLDHEIRQLAFKQRVEIVVELRLGQNFDNSLCGAAQRERIFRSRGHHPDLETLAQRVELIGQRDDLPFARGRNRILHADGLVMFVNRAPDRLGLALRAGVKSADHALEIGELFDHFRREIALGEQRRALGVLIASEFVHQVFDAICLVQVRPKFGLKRDFREIWDAVFEFHRLIDVPEKPRVVEPRSQHALVAVLDEAFGIAAGVHHRHEIGREFSRSGLDRKIFLMMAHHGRQHFRR